MDPRSVDASSSSRGVQHAQSDETTPERIVSTLTHKWEYLPDLTNSESCMICSGGYAGSLGKMTCCMNKIFVHLYCIDNHLNNSNSCPWCKRDIAILSKEKKEEYTPEEEEERRVTCAVDTQVSEIFDKMGREKAFDMVKNGDVERFALSFSFATAVYGLASDVALDVFRKLLPNMATVLSDNDGPRFEMVISYYQNMSERPSVQQHRDVFAKIQTVFMETLQNGSNFESFLNKSTRALRNDHIDQEDTRELLRQLLGNHRDFFTEVDALEALEMIDSFVLPSTQRDPRPGPSTRRRLDAAAEACILPDLELLLSGEGFPQLSTISQPLPQPGPPVFILPRPQAFITRPSPLNPTARPFQPPGPIGQPRPPRPPEDQGNN